MTVYFSNLCEPVTTIYDATMASCDFQLLLTVYISFIYTFSLLLVYFYLYLVIANLRTWQKSYFVIF